MGVTQFSNKVSLSVCLCLWLYLWELLPFFIFLKEIQMRHTDRWALFLLTRSSACYSPSLFWCALHGDLLQFYASIHISKLGDKKNLRHVSILNRNCEFMQVKVLEYLYKFWGCNPKVNRGEEMVKMQPAISNADPDFLHTLHQINHT